MNFSLTFFWPLKTLQPVMTKKVVTWRVKQQKQDELKCLMFAQNNYHYQVSLSAFHTHYKRKL